MRTKLVKQEDKINSILVVVGAIPKGKVLSYGQVAHMAGLLGYARFVGTVLKNLPEESKIPWFRVINSQGRISFPEQSEQFTRQRNALVKEGICFSANNKVDKSHFWNI